MPTSFRLRLECEGLGRGRTGELAFFEEDAGVVEGQAAVLEVEPVRDAGEIECKIDASEEQIEIVRVADTKVHSQSLFERGSFQGRYIRD